MFNLEFAAPWVLYFLLLLPLLAFVYYKLQKNFYPTVKYATLAGIKSAPQSLRSRFSWLPHALKLGGMASIIVALARPQLPLQSISIEAEGIDIMLSMDVSSSMLAQDFSPDRLEASKKVAADFIDRRPNDRIGLISFSGESYTRCPLTTDHVVLQELLSTMQCGLIGDGTAIGMGLANAVKRLKDSKATSKVAILLTDGVNNTGYASPAQAAEAAQKLGVRVYTIGMGTRGKARSPIAINARGEYIYGFTEVEIDEALLQEIALKTGGQYFRATDMKSLEAIYNEIDRLERSKIESTAVKRYEERFHKWLWTALLLLGAAYTLQMVVFKSIVT
jgi:Ca-activated chloride channel family protein